MQIWMFLPTLFFVFIFLKYILVRIPTQIWIAVFHKTHVHFFSRRFKSHKFRQAKKWQKKTSESFVAQFWNQFFYFAQITYPIERNSFQSAYTFSFFCSLFSSVDSVSGIQLKLIHTVAYAYVVANVPFGKTTSELILEIYAITTETEMHINYWAMHHIEWAVDPHWVRPRSVKKRSHFRSVHSVWSPIQILVNSIQKWQLAHLRLASEDSFG